MYLQPNAHAQWFHVLADLQKETSIYLPSEIEHYLLITLIEHSEQSNLLELFIAEHFFEAFDQHFSPAKWQSLGDKCLIINGIFPQWSRRRLRSENFLNQMGKLGYRQASLQYYGAQKKIFSYMHEHFDPLTDFLHHLKTADLIISENKSNKPESLH